MHKRPIGDLQQMRGLLSSRSISSSCSSGGDGGGGSSLFPIETARHSHWTLFRAYLF